MTDAAIALGAPSRSLALSEHRNLRFGVLFLLYFAQGLPFGLIDFALPAWLAQNGASALQDYWNNSALFIGAVFLFTTLAFLRSVTGGSLAMRLCTPAVAATQFAVFLALFNLGRSAASASLGWLDSLGGIPAMFTAMAVCSLIAAAFAFAAKVGR